MNSEHPFRYLSPHLNGPGLSIVRRLLQSEAGRINVFLSDK